MKYQIFSDSEWLYPDTPLAEGTSQKADLICARGADVCFQILTDGTLVGNEHLSVSFDGVGGIPTVYQLLPAHVGENSSAKEFTTTDYESVKNFVTRRAPFDVYEITKLPKDGILEAGRAAFFVRVDVPADAKVGACEGTLALTVGEASLKIPLSVKICKTQIPPLSSARFHMVNWIYYDTIATQHGVDLWSEEYHKVLVAYLENQLDMRNDYLMIPSGEPVRDENGRVIDFDFSHAEYVGNLALSMGFKYVMGGFSVRFKVWNEPRLDLLWERETDANSIEGYRQLKLYFARAWECVLKNGWKEQYYQCIEDEPQFQNSLEYRAVSAICRKMMPGVKIHDPVESTELGGAVDVWVVKQATYEKYIEEYRALEEMGEEMWIYTCGFPAGKMMNRIIDLPLAASRLPMWACAKYGAKGFLHWGYHVHNPEVAEETCYLVEGRGTRFPAGNSFVVYPGEGAPIYGVRGHAQRTGAYDFELLSMLLEKDSERAMELINRLCRGFDDYESDVDLFERTRWELLEILG